MTQTYESFLKVWESKSPYKKPFTIEEHKRTHIDYLEVIIDLDGKVYYAEPSHTEGVVRMVAEKLGVTSKEIHAMIPADMQLDVLEYLAREFHLVAVWLEFFIGEPNEAQQETISTLIEEGLFHPRSIDYVRRGYAV